MKQHQLPAVKEKKVTITRLRTGCWTCRRRGYRCDEEKPSCKTCRRLAVPCEGYGVRLKWHHGRSGGRLSAETCPAPAGTTAGATAGTTVAVRPSTTFGLPSAAPSLPLPMLPGHYSITDVFLLQHYFFTVSSLLSSTPDRSINTYLSTVLPLMMHHDCLLQTVLALSAVHLSSRYPGQFEVYADKLKGDGMRGLIGRLDHCRERPWDEGALATIIMFGILEVFEANADLWSRHLEGAGSFLAAYLDKASPADADNEEDAPCTRYNSLVSRKLLEIYAYHEVLASISLRRPPRLPASFLRGRGRGASAPSSHNPPSNDAVVEEIEGGGQWSAFAKGPERKTAFLSAVDSLLSLVAELSRIRSSPQTDPSSARQRAAGVAEKLRRWSCPDAQYSMETRNTAEAMRQAGLLFYCLAPSHDGKSQMDCSVDAHDEVFLAVETIMDCLRPISVHHSAVASHVWPLYMAGLAARQEHQRRFVTTRLEEMIAVRGIKSIAQVRETLGRIWMAGETGGSGPAVHRQFGRCLVLF